MIQSGREGAEVRVAVSFQYLKGAIQRPARPARRDPGPTFNTSKVRFRVCEATARFSASGRLSIPQRCDSEDRLLLRLKNENENFQYLKGAIQSIALSPTSGRVSPLSIPQRCDSERPRWTPRDARPRSFNTSKVRFRALHFARTNWRRAALTGDPPTGCVAPISSPRGTVSTPGRVTRLSIGLAFNQLAENRQRQIRG